MPHRNKILILENDDFLREILGNLLHKKGAYILNGFTIAQGVKQAENQSIDTIILGTSCKDCDGKSTIHYLNTLFDYPKFFIINNSNQELTFAKDHPQIMLKDLSVEKIIETVS